MSLKIGICKKLDNKKLKSKTMYINPIKRPRTNNANTEVFWGKFLFSKLESVLDFAGPKLVSIDTKSVSIDSPR